jgi:protein-S-isoprenylcysteine O-methyltransferase Ste14
MTFESHSPADATSGVRIYPPAVYLGGLIIGYAIHWLWPLSIAPAGATTAIRILGVVALVLGAGLMLAAVGLFRRAGTPPNPTQPSTALVVDGPYRFTRNPMYLGMALLLAGFALVGNALWPLIAVIPAVIILDGQVIAREEPYLEARFGDAYRELKRRVRRWV